MGKPTSTALTDKQVRILNYLQARQTRGEIPPTTREIQQALGIVSQNSVIQYLRVLERKGFVRTLPGKARGVVAVQPSPASGPVQPDLRSLFIEVPFFGEAQAGPPVNATVPLPNNLPVHAPTMRLTARSRPFALRVRGDSMVGACIQDGDYVVFDTGCEPRPGDVVAAFFDGETTLRRYVVQGGENYLKTENPRHPNIMPLEEFKVQGVMVGLVRGANLG